MGKKSQLTEKPKVQPKNPEHNKTAVYVGRKLSRDGDKVFQRFIKSDGEEMLFQGIKGVWIGYTYKCSDSQIFKKPERIDVQRIDNPEWDAADALVGAKNAEKRASAKMRACTKPALKAATAALKPLMRGLGYFERKALIEYLAEQSKNLK